MGFNFFIRQLRATGCAESGLLPFEEFCYLMIVMRSEKRKRVVSPDTFTVPQLMEERFTIDEIKRSGFPLSAFRSYYGVKRLAQEGAFTALEFRHAGFHAHELHKAGFGAYSMRRAGYSLTELRNCGVSNLFLKAISEEITRRMTEEGAEATLPQVNQSGLEDMCRLDVHMTPRLRFHVDYKPKMGAAKAESEE